MSLEIRESIAPGREDAFAAVAEDDPRRGRLAAESMDAHSEKPMGARSERTPTSGPLEG